MTRTDTRLTDPDAQAVHDAIETAFRRVNAYAAGARVPHTKISLKRIADRTAVEPEGTEFWATRETVTTGIAGQVLVAWWTAISGRRHVRVVGRIVTPETGYLVNASKMNTRPPVWHVFPDRVYRRRAGKANDLVAVCGCGAVGTEKALGWAGPCCGPCFDFQEEHGALPPQRPALLRTSSPCLAVAASADGRCIAGACAGQVRLWDLDSGAEPVYISTDKAETDIFPQLALAPDGRYLAVAGVIHDGLRLITPRGSKNPVAAQIRAVEAVAFHPVQDAMHFIAGGHVMVASPPEARARELAIPTVEHDGPLAFSRDGIRLAVRAGQQIRVHEAGGKTLATIPFPRTNLYRTAPVVPRVRRSLVPHVAFSPDGGQIAIGYDQALAVHHAVTGECRFLDGKLPDAVMGVAFDPGGRWLYVGRHDGTLVAYRTDIISDERSVVFRWSLGPIHALAPCGDSLLTACDEGAQVWPMAKLLEGV
jgi:hypothetical protein